MPNTLNPQTQKRSSADVPGTPVAAAEEREPRGARRKRETRARLLDAAFRLMAEKGVEGVAINEITEAADVGFGSFYNHFESKEAIYNELVNSVFEDFADTLDQLASGLSDTAEVIAVCVRHTLMRAPREPVWGQFLIREGFSARILNRGLGPRLLRDIARGVAAKRFVLADPFVSLASVAGTILASIAAELHFIAPGAPAAGRLEELGFSGAHFAERTAAALLQTLGIKRAEAEKIAQRPLPVAEFEVSASTAHPKKATKAQPATRPRGSSATNEPSGAVLPHDDFAQAARFLGAVGQPADLLCKRGATK